jgi:hypothetical protein
VTVREYCPVGELAGNRHRYDVGTGVVIPWEVAGDPRSGVEACRSCATMRTGQPDSRSDEIDAYLRVHHYDSVEDWAADSDYVRDGDEWRDEDGNTVDIHQYLVALLDEQLRAHE